MDLTPLLSALNGLGPWGIAVGVALTIAFQFWQKRNPAPEPPKPIDPAPAPLPVLPDLANRPLIDLALKLLPLLLARKAAPVATYGAAQAEHANAVEDELVKLVARAVDRGE